MNFGFGKSATKQTTTVKPSAEVENILRRVSQQVIDQEPQEFIAHQYADLSPQARGVLQNMEQSGNLKQLAGMLTPRLAEGIQQVAGINKSLQQQVNAPTDVNSILQQSGVLKQGLQQQSLNQGMKGTSSFLQGSAAARRGLKSSSQAIQARAANDPYANKLAINQAAYNRGSQIEGLGLQSKYADLNTSLGLQGVDYSNQANKNAMNAALWRQQNANALAQNNWQNANARAQFGWDQLLNRASQTDKISGMAGYTQTTTNPGVSNAQGLIGAGIAGAGAVANRYFSQPATAARAGGVSGWGSMFAQRDPNNSYGYQMPTDQGSFWGNVGAGFGSLFGSNQQGGI